MYISNPSVQSTSICSPFIVQITYETIPGDGRFWGYIQVTNGTTKAGAPKNYSLITSRFPRLNEYGEQAKCIDESELHDIAPYCYCRDLLTTTTGKPISTSSSVDTRVNAETDLASATAETAINDAANAVPPIHLVTGPDGTVWLAELDDGKVTGNHANGKKNDDEDDGVVQRLMAMIKKLENEQKAKGSKKAK